MTLDPTRHPDWQLAQEAESHMKPILTLAAEMGLESSEILPYGHYMGKIEQQAVLQRPAGQECVLTAHAAPQWMLDAADYVTEMKCIRHPYQKGIAARKGVEY